MGIRIIRGIGWLMMTVAVVVLLYVVYLLWFTGRGTEQAQREFAEQWTQAVPSPEVDAPTESPQEEDDEPGLPEDLYAALWFERNGSRIITDDELYVVEGVTLSQLARGPGHYPESAAPGDQGNFAVAGHRTTYGAPFSAINDLQDGDTIHVVDRDGVEWVYEFSSSRIVSPTARWVVDEEDPLETGNPTITLTTCHPRYSAAQRLIVFGELVTDT